MLSHDSRRSLLATLVVGLIPLLIWQVAGLAQEKKAGKKKADEAPEKLDPWYRPEGSIVEKSARYYVWFDDNGWHLRSCAKAVREFHGTLRVTDGKIKSCVPVGLKERKTKDAWSVNDDRSVLTFGFQTSTKSDGLDIRIEGDEAKVEFDLIIEKDKKANQVFLGRNEQHPAKNPFTLPAFPEKPKKDVPKK